MSGSELRSSTSSADIEILIESQQFDANSLQVFRLEGHEAISQMFSFALDAIWGGSSGESDFGQLIGASVAIVIRNNKNGDVLRSVYGMVTNVQRRLHDRLEQPVLRLSVVPHASRLLVVDTSQMILNVSIVEVIEQKLKEVSLDQDEWELRLSEDFPKRELVTQYRETNLAFLARLCEHEGIHFHFEHDDDRGKIVFSDNQQGFYSIGTARLITTGAKLDVYELYEEYSLIPPVYAAIDYNPETPLLDIRAIAQIGSGWGGLLVENGVHQRTLADAQRYARVRAEQLASKRIEYRGKSDIADFSPGAIVDIDSVSTLGDSRFLITEVHHHATTPTRLHGGSDERRYWNEFKAVPAGTTYRPPRITPKPMITGMITGFVEHDVDQGIEPWAQLDEQGRYTLRFMLDTKAHPGKQSCPVRMLQPHAGPHYGMHFPLKPGVEVAVAFLNGDPDRPIIVGALPNKVTPSPVNHKNARDNVLKSTSGCRIVFHDEPPLEGD